MADIDSVLAENEHQELVTISPIEEVVNNSAAIEEVVDNSATEEVVDLSATEEVVDNSATEEVVKNAAAIEEADIPNEVRAEDDSKQEPRVVDFKAAVLQPPVKSTRVVHSLPVYNPESLKNHSYGAHSSSTSSRADEFTVLASNKPSTSDEGDEQQQLRDEHSIDVSDDRGDDHQANDTFQLCVVAPKNISECTADIRYEVITLHASILNV